MFKFGSMCLVTTVLCAAGGALAADGAIFAHCDEVGLSGLMSTPVRDTPGITTFTSS